MTASVQLAPGLVPNLSGDAPKVASVADQARSAAQDFEAVFLNTMLQQMFSGVGEGPFNGGYAGGVWRSFLTDEYSKAFAKKGGIGIADQVYRSLMEIQERANATPATAQGPKVL
jgi:Rod binding domain-containing protein